jgi:hypothetical protein
MIAEIIPEIYDAAGRQVSDPFVHRKGPHRTLLMGRYISQPLTIACSSVEDLRKFLAGCKPVSDEELFGKRDYWQPPEEFEKRRKGDCEDFALWTWRQLLMMGYDARFVGGSCGRYGAGHAWVEYSRAGKWYLLEPQLARIGQSMPQLSTIRYQPSFSVAWDGKTLRYYAHKNPDSRMGWRQLSPLVSEYLAFWTFFWVKNVYRIPAIVRNVFRRSLGR